MPGPRHAEPPGALRPLRAGPNVWPGIEACDDALKSLERTLSGEEPPSPEALLRRDYERRKQSR